MIGFIRQAAIAEKNLDNLRNALRNTMFPDLILFDPHTREELRYQVIQPLVLMTGRGSFCRRYAESALQIIADYILDKCREQQILSSPDYLAELWGLTTFQIINGSFHPDCYCSKFIRYL
ncbi:hypothetical protein TetV_142 [Tetraselmis virus 1]|uniref:Uncharacterized protein n=1 Tax=Tetraselmis virus 1 TaxID=2060617 RepID=A0A2P0VMU7_9VIRU|nr:hypothetical protein QJ968_gp142 [Tetraselmis virus 1]AUF82234.1 hypothetical protein TetV_142 [Tetraselmis virus 1]